MTTNNAGLRALTTDDELQEVQAVGKRRKIKFAFFQSDFKGGRIPFWHVNYVSPSDFGTTLSMDGLKQWRII
jgi:hypothetical protein